VALVLAIVVSAVAAWPFAQVVLYDNEAGWFTSETAVAYGDDIGERTAPGDIVMAETAAYLTGSHAIMPRHDSRATAHVYSSFSDHPEAPPLRALYANLSAGMQSGRVQLVVAEKMTRRILADNATTHRLFETQYCRVSDAATQRLYDRTNATLFAYRPADCPAGRPTLNGPK
jgi:hypothetical protein